LSEIGDLFWRLVDFFLHLDRHLQYLLAQYGNWTYLVLVGIVFCETGLVVTPFLPGDSLLFAAGAFAALGLLDLRWLLVLLTAAAIAGDSVNYWTGKALGPRLARGKGFRLIRQQHLERTHAYFERYGGRTILIARFVPIVRTIAPFVAGVGTMTYRRFMAYNVVGGVLWVASCTLAGYFFGNLPVVRDNFTLVILGIVAVSLVPGLIEVLRARRERNRADARVAAVVPEHPALPAPPAAGYEAAPAPEP
jgi:membrane-associated protein